MEGGAEEFTGDRRLRQSRRNTSESRREGDSTRKFTEWSHHSALDSSQPHVERREGIDETVISEIWPWLLIKINCRSTRFAMVFRLQFWSSSVLWCRRPPVPEKTFCVALQMYDIKRMNDHSIAKHQSAYSWKKRSNSHHKHGYQKVFTRSYRLHNEHDISLFNPDVKLRLSREPEPQPHGHTVGVPDNTILLKSLRHKSHWNNSALCVPQPQKPGAASTASH